MAAKFGTMRQNSRRSSQPSRKRGTQKLLGLGLMLFYAAPLAGCQNLNSSLIKDWGFSQGEGIPEAQAAATKESPETIAQEIQRLTQEIAQLTASHKDWGRAHYERAHYHRINDDFDAAITDYNIAATAYGDRDAQLYSDRGLAHESLGNGEAAIADYTKAIAVNEGWADEPETLAVTYASRGEVHESLKNLDAALADYNTAIALDASLSYAFYDRAYLHHSQENLIQAIKDFTSYIQLTAKPGSWAYYSRGVANEDYGRSAQALADYSEAISLNDWGQDDPELNKQDQADAYFARAWLHHHLGNYRRAIQGYSESLKLHPMDSLTLYNRGLVHDENGDLAQALADYSSAIELNQNWGQIDISGNYLGLGSALYNRGLIYQLQGNGELAQGDFRASKAAEKALEQSHS